MRICLDARTVGQRMHGIARYSKNLLQAIEEVHSPHTFYVIGQDPLHFPFIRQTNTRLFFIRARVPPYSLLEQVVIPALVARLMPEVYHCLTYACPVLVPSRLFFTVHDLLPLVRPKEFKKRVRVYFRSFVRIASSRASRIIVDSHYSAFMCSHLLGIPFERISVVPLGGDHLQNLPMSIHTQEEFHGLNLRNNPYFLCVGNPRLHKRVLYLVRLFSTDPLLRTRDVHLVLVGEQHPEVYAWVARDGPDSRIHCTGYISDSLLVALYRNTIGLVFPASGEGFGLPVLEAMHFGVPVLASQDGAQSELIGRAGIMLPPDDEESWRRAMCELLLDAKKRERFAGLAANEAMNYSWHSTAIKTLHVYEEAVDLDDKR